MSLLKKIFRVLTITLFLPGVNSLNAQHKDQVYVDKQGVLRWSDDKSEIHGFGVNYTLPFAHEFRMVKESGISLEETIDQDVYHMARLDLDLYRVHVWDTEISDTNGNLIKNEHLRLLDYTLAQMKKRGMHFIITPIAYWGNGWPEADEKTPGFSNKYGKQECLTNADAIKAQANYLYQFLNHVNLYTHIAYKDEPGIIGFEICNEPHHDSPEAEVTAFINTMSGSVRKTGCKKPVFYNMSHSIHLVNAYVNADIQGGTFQWYPTNLVANHQINGNFLPQVISYDIPFVDNPQFKKMAKIVYEFDPADANGNIMYAAMAKTFRQTGFQLAAQFDYDAITWAPYNTNYGTHFLNMAYTPQKAISMKIASAIFHQMPMNQPEWANDSTLKINYKKDLAEWVTGEQFFYSNNTATFPKNLANIKEIAGCGSSPIIKYTGTGIYIVDKLVDGVWRLEVMPDAWWINDPYSPVNPKIQKAAVQHTLQQMTIQLPDLGKDFTITPLNNGNSFKSEPVEGQFEIWPGVYILRAKNNNTAVQPDQQIKNIRLNEYAAPASNLKKTAVWNYTESEITAGKKPEISFKVASPGNVIEVRLIMSNGNQWETLTIQPQINNAYHIEVPLSLSSNGFLKYQIVVETSKDTVQFPAGSIGDPNNWMNRNTETWQMAIMPQNAPLLLWNAATDWDHTYNIWNRNVMLKPTGAGQTVLNICMDELPRYDLANTNCHDYPFKFYFGDRLKGRIQEINDKKMLMVKAHNYLTVAQPAEIGLIDENGTVMAGEVMLEPGETICKIPVNTFKSAPYYVLPRPYPDFLRYKYIPQKKDFVHGTEEMLQVVIKPGKLKNVNLDLEKIWLE